MKRINTPDGRFAAGDPTIRKPGTLVTSTWMNTLQDEICNAIEGAGLTLDENNPAQLHAAMANTAAQGDSDLQTQITSKANIDSPELTGEPTAPTPPVADNSTRIATTSHVHAALQVFPAEPRYHSVIDLTGLPTDRFYPVWWTSGGNNWAVHRLTIARTYYEDQEKEPFEPGLIHIASLLLEIETSANVWSGDSNFLQVKRLKQNYRKTVRQIRFAMKCSTVVPAPGTSLMAGVTNDCYVSSGCYLRGGLSYHVYSNHWEALQYTRQSGQVMVGEATDTSNNKSARWMAQSRTINDSFLGDDYNNFIIPYNAFPYTV